MPALYSLVLLLSPGIVTEAVDSFGIVKPQSVTTKTLLSISNNRFVLKQPLFLYYVVLKHYCIMTFRKEPSLYFIMFKPVVGSVMC